MLEALLGLLGRGHCPAGEAIGQLLRELGRSRGIPLKSRAGAKDGATAGRKTPAREPSGCPLSLRPQ